MAAENPHQVVRRDIENLAKDAANAYISACVAVFGADAPHVIEDGSAAVVLGLSKRVESVLRQELESELERLRERS